MSHICSGQMFGFVNFVYYRKILFHFTLNEILKAKYHKLRNKATRIKTKPATCNIERNKHANCYNQR